MGPFHSIYMSACSCTGNLVQKESDGKYNGLMSLESGSLVLYGVAQFWKGLFSLVQGCLVL